MIISKTPFRVSLFGGGTDYYEWFSKKEKKGAVLGFSINKYCYITLKELNKFSDFKFRLVYNKLEQGNNYNNIKHVAFRKILHEFGNNKNLEINYFSDLPARTGIGSSSSFIVGLLSAIYKFKKIKYNKKKLSIDAIRVEREVLNEKVGFQDQILTANGGLNLINFKNKSDYTINKINISNSRKLNLQKSLFLVNTGIRRVASNEAKKQISAFSKKEDILDELYQLVFQAKNILKNHLTDLEEIGKLLDYSWLLKKQITESISSSKIDELYDYGIKKGATGGKLLGAGNGGFILFYVKKKNIKNFLRSFKENQVVDISFDNNGNTTSEF